MVMKRNAMRKNVRRTILHSLGRYIAIVLIIALGAGMFVGLLTTKTDMVATAQRFTDETNMFHLRLLNTYGWTAEQVANIHAMEGVKNAEGGIFLDVIGRQHNDTQEGVYRLHSIQESVNKVHLLGGRMPQSPEECLVDGAHVDDSVLGTQFHIADDNAPDTLESLNGQTFTVVGYVSTPLYMDMARGNTDLGSGSLTSYVYLPKEAFAVDYFTEIVVTMDCPHPVYSEELTKAMEDFANRLEPGVKIQAELRFDAVKTQAMEEYNKGLQEYLDGLAEFEEVKNETNGTLSAALAELQKGQAELDSNAQLLEDGRIELNNAQAELDNNAALLVQSRQELASAKSLAYAQIAAAYEELGANQILVASSLAQVLDGMKQIEAGIPQIEDGLAQIAEGLEQLNLAITLLDAQISILEDLLVIQEKWPVLLPEYIQTINQELETRRQERAKYEAQRQEVLNKQAELTVQLDQLKTQYAELESTKKTLDEANLAIEQGKIELEKQKASAESQFAEAERKILEGQAQLEAGQKLLDERKAELQDGMIALGQAQAELDAHWAEYEQGRVQADEEFAAAEAKLAEAKSELDAGKAEIDNLTAPELYILNRNTNVGYLAVNHNSDIVAGVSRVFPAFFLLVAALVCITTMTRMVDEERTQIGIMKALGYGNGAIVRKYLVYSGSAAVVGCGLGVLVGSVVFPKILWAAYSIILNLTPDVVLTVNWPLCLAVVVAYTLVSMLVTWYCCRRELREVPAELIRPKAPAAGKKILLERLPFWKRISFLNKVMFRNVFRYRQRLLMMMVGIGGCAALLLTGFGVGDSIMNIVDYQFAEVTTYDIEVYFSEGKTIEEQMSFRNDLKNQVDKVLFYHQSSVDLEFDNGTKGIYLRVADDNIGDFINLHRDGDKLTMPGEGETLLSIGVAEAMGIKEGDTITIRDASMRTLKLKVSGIFDNHVYNFAIVRPETIQSQWNETPEYQMAYITVRDDQDAHAAGAKISAMEDVMNVSISEDVAEQVGSMLDAMNLVVLTIVICAALLAMIVLYNLTNISITERMREIATIKVLGFRSRESAAYVFKENLLLSAMGTVLGLIGGIFLLRFVMSQIKIDMVWFQTRLEPMSFFWATVITMVSACVVDFLLYFKLERINMAEALKSVE